MFSCLRVIEARGLILLQRNCVRRGLCLADRIPSLDATTFAWSAAIVRQRRDVFNAADRDTRNLEAGDGTFATGTRSVDADFHFLDAELASLVGTGFRRPLSGEGCALTRPLEAHRSGAAPAQDIAVDICDRHERVVEARPDVGNGLRHVLANFFLLALLRCAHVCIPYEIELN